MQTLVEVVTPTVTNTPKNDRHGKGGSSVQGRGQDGGGRGGDCRNSTIAKSSFEGKMKDSYFHKLTITECTHQATQYKKIINALPVLCVDKEFRFVDNGICTNTVLVKTAFLPLYPNKALWSNVTNVQMDTSTQTTQ